MAADRGGRKKPKANVHTHTHSASKAHMKSQHIWHCHPPNNQSSLFVVEAANMTARDMRFPLSLYPVVVNLPATYLLSIFRIRQGRKCVNSLPHRSRTRLGKSPEHFSSRKKSSTVLEAKENF